MKLSIFLFFLSMVLGISGYAGSFLPISVKTHESATNARFRFDFDVASIKLWTKDKELGTVLTNQYLQVGGDRVESGFNYSYNDLFESAPERIVYVQALSAGAHNIDIVYVLDGQDLWTEKQTATFLSVVLKEPDGLPVQSVMMGDSRFRLNPACFEWQYVHVDNELITYYASQPIECEVVPETFEDFEWIVTDGTIINPSSKTPIYKPNNMPVPASVNNVQLKIQLPSGLVAADSSRTIEVYRDHLERDYNNWPKWTECGAPFPIFFWEFDRYGQGWRMPNSWNCFGSVWHAYNGTKNGYATDIPTAGFSVKVYDEPIPWSQVTSNLVRGDFVSFYTYDAGSNTEVMQHAHTAVGVNNLMFGANNEPIFGWYVSRDADGNGGVGRVALGVGLQQHQKIIIMV